MEYPRCILNLFQQYIDSLTSNRAHRLLSICDNSDRKRLNNSYIVHIKEHCSIQKGFRQKKVSCFQSHIKIYLGMIFSLKIQKYVSRLRLVSRQFWKVRIILLNHLKYINIQCVTLSIHGHYLGHSLIFGLHMRPLHRIHSVAIMAASNLCDNYTSGRGEEEEVNQVLISSWWMGITLSAAEMLAMRSVLHPGCGQKPHGARASN